MNKPEYKTVKYIDWYQATQYIEKKYKIKTRDFYNSHDQFGIWCDSKGYGQYDPVGKHRGSSQIWYAEYSNEITDGIVKQIPYCDFWHWIIDNIDVSNRYISLYKELKDEVKEPFQLEILELYWKEFGVDAVYGVGDD